MVDTTNIPGPNGVNKTVKRKGSTKDIIASIQGMESYFDSDFCRFAQQFGNDREGLRKLWHFVKYKIKYVKDDFKVSKQLTPPALWSIKKGDCKSKTIFINAVLRCLKIPYLTRYTNYNSNDQQVKHVYTVAIVDGKELPIDSVYDFFGSEKKYNKKIDYPMAEIIEISGINETRKQGSTSGPYIHTFKNCVTSIRASEAAKTIQEIKQKQQYVKKPAPIEFSKISEAQAIIEIAVRELSIIKVMKPELKRVADKGLSMLYAAQKGNFCPTGDIPKSLTGTYNKIKAAERMQHKKANCFGLSYQKIEHYKNELYSDRISGYPERLCLNSLWFLEQNPAAPFSYEAPLPGSSNNGMCQGAGGNDNSFLNIADRRIMNNPSLPKFGDALFYGYGRNSEYRVTLNESLASIQANLATLRSSGVLTGWSPPHYGKWSYWFNTKANYDLMVEELNQSSGVLDKYLNSVFAANITDTPNGTAGSGLLYSFVNGMDVNGLPVNLNRLPGTVLSKRGFQDQFLDGANMFSGISRSSVQGLARNGVLFDNNGLQPEITLNRLLEIHEGRAEGINDFGITAAIIAAIAAAVIGIIGAIGGAVEQAQKGETQARLIDTSAADTARFSTLGSSLMPEQDDFIPTDYKSGLNDGKPNPMLLVAAAALGAAALLPGKKKK
jgi:hypothetical protein